MPGRCCDAEHYELLVREAIANARVAVWIGTANVKAMMVEAPIGTAARARRAAVSVLHAFEGLARRGVELRLLHASLPSRAFRDELARLPSLRAGGLAMRRCPRVHFKVIVVDGTHLYVGSANFTGAGLGAKGRGRRNFELGVVTDDDVLLDVTQARFERVWSGAECAGCRLRAHCPEPLDRPRLVPLGRPRASPDRPARGSAGKRTVKGGAGDALLAGGGHARALQRAAYALHDGVAVLAARHGRVAVGGRRQRVGVVGRRHRGGVGAQRRAARPQGRTPPGRGLGRAARAGRPAVRRRHLDGGDGRGLGRRGHGGGGHGDRLLAFFFAAPASAGPEGEGGEEDDRNGAKGLGFGHGGCRNPRSLPERPCSRGATRVERPRPRPGGAPEFDARSSRRVSQGGFRKVRDLDHVREN
jgi:hypothetical protein